MNQPVNHLPKMINIFFMLILTSAFNGNAISCRKLTENAAANKMDADRATIFYCRPYLLKPG